MTRPLFRAPFYKTLAGKLMLVAILMVVRMSVAYVMMPASFKQKLLTSSSGGTGGDADAGKPAGTNQPATSNPGVPPVEAKKPTPPVTTPTAPKAAPAPAPAKAAPAPGGGGTSSGSGSSGGSSAACSTTPSAPGSSDPWGGCWPGEQNTGVPDGVVLSAYTGSCTITTANTVIDAKTVNCILSVRAANVTISRSYITGGVDIPSSAPASASFVISDSRIHIGDNLNTGLMRRNFTANRVEITGGRRSVYCMSNCTIENTWVHAQGGDPEGEAHFSGIRMEQGTTVRHNFITCEANRHAASGCSAGLTGYGDFAAVQNNLIERNIFTGGGGGASTTCDYGGSSGDDGGKPYGHLAENIRFIGNRFVKGPSGRCGNLRTIIDFNASRPGNVWTDNLYTDGTVVNAAGP